MTREDAWDALCGLVPTEGRGRCVDEVGRPLPVAEWTEREREQICSVVLDLMRRVEMAEARR